MRVILVAYFGRALWHSRVMSVRLPLAVGLGGLALALTGFWSSPAFAFCQTTTCAQKPPPADCAAPPEGQCQSHGLPVAWPKACASFSVQLDGSAKRGISAGTVEDLLRLAFDQWQNADCGNSEHPAIRVETYPRVECGEVRHNAEAPNQNVWTFRDNNWVDDTHDESMIALTSVQFLPSTGEIVDVDAEFNSDLYPFSTSTAEPGVDLQSVIQHESGHFLGLDHSFVASATMYYGYKGSVAMRTLDTDDEAGLCSIYPPDDAALQNCDPEPENGFSTECKASSDPDGCSCKVGTGSRGGHTMSWMSVVALLGLSLCRRRKPIPTCDRSPTVAGQKSLPTCGA